MAVGARFLRASSSGTHRSEMAPRRRRRLPASRRGKARFKPELMDWSTLTEPSDIRSRALIPSPRSGRKIRCSHCFSEKDLDLPVSSKFFLGGKKMTLREMIATLENIYADTIGT